MKKLTISDVDGGEILEEFEFSGGYNVAFTNTHDEGQIRHINKLHSAKFGKSHWIKNYTYQPIAIKLCTKFEEIHHISPWIRKILFIEDCDWEPGNSGKRPWIAKVSLPNKHLTSISGYEYIIEIRRFYVERMSREQVAALIYHELRHINQMGEIIEHDIEDWSNMVATLVANWNSTKSSIIYILDEDFEEWDILKEPGRQMSLFDQAGIRAVK